MFKRLFILAIVCSIWSSGIAKAIETNETQQPIQTGVYSMANATKIDVKGSLFQRVTEEDQRKIDERKQVEKQRKQTDNLIKGIVILIVALGGIYGLIKGVLYIKSKIRLPIEITIKYKQEK